jgi:hypothetical protein
VAATLADCGWATGAVPLGEAAIAGYAAPVPLWRIAQGVAR